MPQDPMDQPLRIFVGYDSREDIAWQVCRASILRHSAPDLEIRPLKLTTLRTAGLYYRHDDRATTEFSLTRFLTPHLSAAQNGWSIFVDCDFLFTTDIRNVLSHVSQDNAVHVVQHDYVPTAATKMDGQVQTTYPRKNWSSFMVFNNGHPDVRALTPAMVNSAPPSHLHRLEWVADQDQIGALPVAWNFLVGEYARPARLPFGIHYTNGGPWFEACQGVDFAAEWRAERDRYLASLEGWSAECG